MISYAKIPLMKKTYVNYIATCKQLAIAKLGQDLLHEGGRGGRKKGEEGRKINFHKYRIYPY